MLGRGHLQRELVGAVVCDGHLWRESEEARLKAEEAWLKAGEAWLKAEEAWLKAEEAWFKPEEVWQGHVI